jgi:hypothetical protein
MIENQNYPHGFQTECMHIHRSTVAAFLFRPFTRSLAALDQKSKGCSYGFPKGTLYVPKVKVFNACISGLNHN